MNNTSPIDNWLADVRLYVSEQAPELLPTLDVYLGEARFGRQYIASDLMQLSPGAAVLEVGAGALLLSCQLVREGFQVTALEPTGDGFSHFERMRELVLVRAKVLGCLPRILNQSAETLSECDCFDYAFSINVMEHVDDVELTIANVGRSLKSGATYRFTCPNYWFPYEQHFNLPTLFSKRLTEKLLGDKIFHNKTLPDPHGTWLSLNWINVMQISRAVKQSSDLNATFNRLLLVSTFERVITDKEFAMRRPNVVRIIISALVRLRLHHLLRFIPAIFQPIIDCTITRNPHGLMESSQ